MITPLSGFPDNTIAIAGSGRITAEDYETQLIPLVEQAFETHGKLRLYYQLESEFSGFEAGAMWDDFKLGVAHFGDWERVAVVTDVDWIRRAAKAFAFLMPCEVGTFDLNQAAAARQWICATSANASSSSVASTHEAVLEEVEFEELVREELQRRRSGIASDTRHLVEKHQAILASEMPEIRPQLADALILVEVRTVLDQIEMQGPP